MDMRILVAEDDSNMREMLKIAFENNSFSVDLANDGEVAFEKASSVIYDIIVLDLMLPKKLGFEVISGLRKLGITTPIMVISGALDAENRDRALALGADDFVVKNFSIVELLGRVKNCANKNPDVLESQKLRLNVPNKEVEVKGDVLPLDYGEFNILFKLLSNKHAILNEEDLDKRALESLEEKIGDDVIEHVEGFGYMIAS